MATYNIKTIEQELTNGDLKFTAQISFKSSDTNNVVKLNHGLPSFTMKDDEPMSIFAQKIDELKETARVIAENTLVEDAKAIQKELNKKFRKSYGKEDKELPKFS